jgi:hypothetical protein
MALPNLAVTADLAARGIDTTDTAKVTAFLAAASAEVRNAIGSAITQGTYTVDLGVSGASRIRLPVTPVTAVASVLQDGLPVTDWKLIDGQLWRKCGWASSHCPAVATVTFTGGYASVPADLIDLVCSLVGLALAIAAGGGYSTRGDLTGVRVDDYSEQYIATAVRESAVLALTPATRERLRNLYGPGTVAAVNFR